jgi:hypothetical protein
MGWTVGAGVERALTPAWVGQAGIRLRQFRRPQRLECSLRDREIVQRWRGGPLLGDVGAWCHRCFQPGLSCQTLPVRTERYGAFLQASYKLDGLK